MVQTMKSICKHFQAKRQRLVLAGAGASCFFVVLIWSAAEAFQRQTTPIPLATTERIHDRPKLGNRPAPIVTIDLIQPTYEVVHAVTPTAPPEHSAAHRTSAKRPRPATTDKGQVKLDRAGNPILVNGKPWTGEVFDHRPIRPVKTRTMKTTAYSPDHRSCGKWADGITASGKSVWMNGGRLVAADPKIPYGTILTIPGYNAGKPVQVWDRGGKIKGNRLDVLYPTHEIALRWGVQDLPVVFWAFVEAD